MTKRGRHTAPDAVLDAVRERSDRAAALDRAIAPVMVERAEHLHAAYAAAISRPELFARGDANRSVDHELAERSIRAEIAAALRVSERTASRDLDRASMLVEHLPATRAALSTGRILWDAGVRICDAAASLPEGSREVFDERAVDLAEDMTPQQLTKPLARLREELHEVPFIERHRRAAEDRTVWLSPVEDGMCQVTTVQPAPSAVAMFTRVDRMARALRKVEGETRTLAQLRADVMAELQINGDVIGTAPGDPVLGSGAMGSGAFSGSASGSAAPAGAGASTPGAAGAGATAADASATSASASAPTNASAGAATADESTATAEQPSLPAFVPGIRAEVRITVPVLTAAGVDNAPADLDGYGPIPAEIARELVGTASHYYRVLTDPITDHVVSVGRAMRTPPENMRRFLRLRDGTCRFPGCTRPAATSEADHTKPWSEGGDTSIDNLVNLCTAHHHVRHGDRWNYFILADGTIEWITPTGRLITTKPATLPTSKRWPRFVDTEPDDTEPNGTGPDGTGPRVTDPEDTTPSTARPGTTGFGSATTGSGSIDTDLVGSSDRWFRGRAASADVIPF